MKNLVVAALLGSACGGSDDVSAVEVGEALVRESTLGSSFNVFTCDTCHSLLEDGASDRILPGYTLFNSAFRESWWGGYEVALLDSVDFCVQFFMGGAPLASESDEARALYAYLVSISPQNPSPALPLEIVENVTKVPRGSPSRGAAAYDQACRFCHGAAETGDGRLQHSTLSSDNLILPQWTGNYVQDFPGIDPSLVVIEKVRHGQFFLVGGNMPFFTRDKLSDDDLGAILAFLGL